MITRMRAIGRFWYDFIIGDDWRVAVAVILSFAATYAVDQWTSVAAWWLVPAAVVVVLPLSLRRALHNR